MPALSLLTTWISALMVNTEGSLLNKAHCIVDCRASCLLLLLDLYFTAEISLLRCVNEHSWFYCCLLTSCLFLYIIAILYLVSEPVIFILCNVLTIFLNELRRKGTGFVQFILCLEHFVYFPLKMLVPSFNNLMQEMIYFQRLQTLLPCLHC